MTNIDHILFQVQDATSRENENQARKRHYNVRQRENNKQIQKFDKKIFEDLNEKQQINKHIYRKLYVDYFKAQLSRKSEIKQSIFIENRRLKDRKRNFWCSTLTRQNEMNHQGNIIWLLNSCNVTYSLQER